jgi:hypothetical protein
MNDAVERGFDPQRLLAILATHEVDFVLIGGWAAKLHGSPTVTADIDICYARDDANLVRLADALSGLDIRLRGVADDVPFTLDVRTLRAGDVFTLSSSAGDIDLLGSPAGVGSFEVLREGSDVLELDDLTIHVASLDDLVRMKMAAGRPKDLIEVEVLEALRQETRE